MGGEGDLYGQEETYTQAKLTQFWIRHTSNGCTTRHKRIEFMTVQHKHSIQAHNQNLNKGIHRSTKPPLTWTCKCPKPRNAKSNQRPLTAARSNSPHSANAGKRAQKLRNNSRKLRKHTTSARARRAKKNKTKIKSCISGYKPEPTTRETLRKQFIKVSRIKKRNN